MAKPEELYERWKKSRPTDVDREDLRKVAKHYLGEWLTERSGSGSHFLLVEHPALAIHSAFGGHDTLSISLKSGKRVKGVWVSHLLKAIEAIQLYNEIMNERK